MNILLPAALLASLTLFAATPSIPAPQKESPLAADYLEARSASVFAGACHYNGELVTTGQDAILALHLTAGTHLGQNLANLSALAAITSTQNLADENAPRHSELIIDSSATDAQAHALTDALESQFPKALGTVTTIKRAPISFQHSANNGYKISAKNFATLTVDPMPDDACCKQPNLVWYTPLFPIAHRKVGFTTTAAYTANTLTEPWQRNNENSAFYGQLTTNK